MKITDIEIRACRWEDQDETERGKLAGGRAPDVVVISLHTDEGVTGTSFGFGGLNGALTAAAFAQVKPFFLGRDPFAREQNAREFRAYDRKWNHVPIYAYGPFDNACWDIVGKTAGQPVHRLLGSAHERLPVYASSMFMSTVEDYVSEALAVQAAGFHGYKLHPPGPWQLDLEACAAVREAVGPDFTLMSDPVATYSFGEAVRVGRRLEQLDFSWLEEPFYDYDVESLRELTRTLDIPIAGTETIMGEHVSTASVAASRTVDILRTDVSWRGGISAVMKTAHLADSFGMQCELHTTIYHPLELVNLQCALAISNTQFFEVLYPMEQFELGITTSLDIRDGYIYPTVAPGLGVAYDWAAIEGATLAVF